ncbi:MAG: ATP-binding cassette domain-containing protein [Thioalkalivibrio sp.]
MNRAARNRPLLALEGISFERGGTFLLERVSLDLSADGRTVILGPNGAGKSLLMRIAHGLVQPTRGRVTATDHVAGPPHQAMVFQRPVLLRRSVLANITYVLSLRGSPWRARRQEALRALERFGLQELAHRPARVLSGGEQQRLALARAWALHPRVLFLDEPTAALDPAATLTVERAVNTFHSEGTKIVMATHDLGQARRLADDVVFLCRGRLMEHTPVERFFNAPVTDQAAGFLRGDLVF